MNSENKKPKEKNNRKREEKKNILQQLAVFIPVWIQIIICLGGVVTAFVTSPVLIPIFFGTATPTLITEYPSTDVTPKSFENPPADNVTLTLTDTPAPPLLPGQDWRGNCINSTIWKPYLAGEIIAESSQCYQLSKWGINAEQGRLIFALNHSQNRAYEYGILTPWQDWTEIDFTVKAERQDNSEIWVGFFEGDTPDSTGVVFVIQPGDEIDIREMPHENELVDNIYLKYAGGIFHPRIIFEGGKIAVWVDGQGIISKWPVNFTIRNMFIGYRTLPSTNLNATVSELKFTP